MTMVTFSLLPELDVTTEPSTAVMTFPSASVKANVVAPVEPRFEVDDDPPLGCLVSVTMDEPEANGCMTLEAEIQGIMRSSLRFSNAVLLLKDFG